MANFHVIAGASERPAHPVIRKIGAADLKEALKRGWDDFAAIPTHVIFVCLIYPIIGLVLGRLAIGYAVLPLLFPLIAGFALLGPLAAVGLYELSRRREAGLDSSWWHVFDVLKSPSIGAITALGILLMIIFLGWLYTAQTIYQSLPEALSTRPFEVLRIGPVAAQADLQEPVATQRAGLDQAIRKRSAEHVARLVADRAR